MSFNIPEAFMPRWHSVFHNPFYILRKRLFQGIARNAHYIKGMVLDFGCGNKPYLDLFNYEKYIGLDFETEVSMRLYGKADVYYDGKLVKSYTTNDNLLPEYMILNIGAGQNSPTMTGAAGQMKVDYVRAWQK